MFEFELGQEVELKGSDEHGVCVSRAEHQTAENNYLVRYQCGNGRLVVEWWTESALQAK